jgi:hypothetical protein
VTAQQRKPTTGGIIIGSSYDEARTRKINAEAEIAELELAKIRGTLCMTDDVVKAWESVLHACKAKFLSLPTKVAPVVANESDVAKVKDFLEGAIREALTELSNYQPEIDPVRTGSGAVENDPGGEEEEPKPKRKVGRPKKGRTIIV